MRIMDGVTWGCICLKIDVIAANEKYLKTIGHFFVSLCCRLLT